MLSNSWHMHYTKQFMMNGSRYVVAAGWYGRNEGRSPFLGDSPGDARIELIELPSGLPKRLATSTKFEDRVMVHKATVHLFQASPKAGKTSGRDLNGRLPLLSVPMTGGQWSFTRVFRFDKDTLRPKLIQEFDSADDSRLGSGIMEESNPIQYVERKDWPRDTPHQWLARTWRLSPNTLTSSASKWRWERSSIVIRDTKGYR